MSQIAAKNQQRELVDVNNLWKWPVAYSSDKTYYNPTNELVPDLDVWYANVADTGYFNTNTAMWPMCTFDSKSVTIKYSAGYAAGVFLRLEPGEYDFSCDEILTPDDSSAVYFVEYQLMSSGKYIRRGAQHVSFKGHCQTKFTVKPDNLILLWLGPRQTDTLRTFTNIRIK